MITILGGYGNMGSRYGAILKKLGVDFLVADINVPVDLKRTTGLIIATPTDSHLSDIERFHGLPILCEKPISRYLSAIDRMKAWQIMGARVTMIDQYAHIKMGRRDVLRDTYYSSWHSGKDTLAWDCINIIAKASDLSRVNINNTAPKGSWNCRINGKPLKLENMAQAYEDMLVDWIGKKSNNLDYMIKAHEKVWEFKRKCEANT